MPRKARRSASLRRMLDERRRELQGDVQNRLRGARADPPDHGGDELEASDAAMRRDHDYAMLEMRAETLALIDAALVRFDAGDYGTCVACDGEIAEQRLRALPFAMRCRACETAREVEPDSRRPFEPRIGTLASVVLHD